MAFEDFMETEVAAAAAVTAAAFSPQVRGLLRRGLVYGVAGVLEVGGAAKAAADGVVNAARQRRTSAASEPVSAGEAEAVAAPLPARRTGGGTAPA